MPVPQKIIDLVERFSRNIDSYKSGNYNETQVRREFIDPFFEALGWDVANTKGYAEAYKDVIHEYSLKTKEVVKAPDYLFKIGGIKKFFVEAKKPSVNLKDDISPAFQLRRYAWSAKLQLSILTDFEEFAIYDCRIQPKKTDKSSTARIHYFTFEEYIEKWDEIESIFSREAILKGSFDKFAESKKGKRGTAEVDDAFLKEIENWRAILARNIALRNSALTNRELNYAVQKTIDRIIFLRICEDRGIEEYGQLMNLLSITNVYRSLLQIFTRANEKYNSGLFHFDKEKGRYEPHDEITPLITIDDKVLKEIIKNLYYPDSPYEFSVLAPDILGHVYEQFLGKIIRLTPSHQAKIEEKPEVKKAGGVYYTPTYIVNYIVENTLGKKLEEIENNYFPFNCHAELDSASKAKIPKLVRNDIEDAIKEVSKLKILDPACGSGSFLIGAYQYLLDWHLKIYTSSNEMTQRVISTKQSPIYQAKKDEYRLTTNEKKRILLNNIFGVDIDSQAVEVTKLSLLLKVLEGESDESITTQLSMFRERALPDLSNNIKCGNSLIGPDFYDQAELDLDDEERFKINVFDWETEFKEIMSSGGFDCVIGNPPYVQVAKDIFGKNEIVYLLNYNTAQYKTDLYHLFIEEGIKLLKKDGLFSFITPNTWLTLKFVSKLRIYVLQNTSVLMLSLFNYKVFSEADVFTIIFLLSKGAGIHNTKVKFVEDESDDKNIMNKKLYTVDSSNWLQNENAVFEYRFANKEGIFAKKIIDSNATLNHVARASLGCQAYNSSKHTKEEIKKRIFHSTFKESADHLPELAGADVSRYLINREKGQWIKYGSWLHDYRSIDWLQGPRILIREIAGKNPHSIHACYLEDTYCNYKTILNVNPSQNSTLSMKYICGLLNSNLLSFIYPYISNKIVVKSFPRISVGDLRNLPIKKIDFDNEVEIQIYQKIIINVDMITKLMKSEHQANMPQEKTALQRQIDATDKQIDNLVYELYGLTEEEIKIVEQSIS